MSDDKDIWDEFTKGVTPIKQGDNQYFKSESKSKIHPKDTNPPLLSDGACAQTIGIEDVLFFAQPGVQHKTIRALKKGELTIEDEIDLHGLTVEKSRKQLTPFLENAYQSGKRCVLVIHGKGTAVLKSRVNHWLPQLSFVLAFCSAKNRGATGAVYVLLKRKRRTSGF